MIAPDEGDGQASDGPWRIAERCVLCLAPGAELPDFSEGGFPLDDVFRVGSSPAIVTSALRDAAVRRGRDVLLIGAGVEIDAAAALEVRRVASTDPMIAGVSPRFEAARSSPSAGAWRRLLPAVTYVPLPDPRCLYVKASVLAQVRPGPLDRPMDWDAYAMLANAVGFRMARANHAAARLGDGSDDGVGAFAARAQRLEPTYPGARAAVASFRSGAPEDAAKVLAGLAPDADGRRLVAFDLTHIGRKRSGTGEAALALIRGASLAWAEDWTVCVVATRDDYAAHFEPAPKGPRRIDPADDTVCAAFVRIGQPFGWKEVDAAVRRAPALIFFMLDTIGLDCMRLAPDDLDALWRFVLAEADGLLFNSAFTARQYERRFGVRAGQPRLASLHSLETRDYAPAQAGAVDGTILIIGNGFPHKAVEATARLLADAFPQRSIAALGLGAETVEGVAGFRSGDLDDATLAALYGRAGTVVYPSLYEGFGFPLIEALAHRKPVLARALPPFAEIAAGVAEAANIHIFRTDEELVALLCAPPVWSEARSPIAARRWEDGVADLRRILDDAVSGISYDRVLRRIDFLRGRLAWARQRPFDTTDGLGDDLDRLSALAGRLARSAVLAAARLPGARLLLRRAFAATRRR